MTTGPKAFESLLGQERVKMYLSAAIQKNAVSHAYLFLGVPGSGKTDAVWAFSEAILCDKGGCDACDSCIRVKRHTHPDVHLIDPEGVSGYMIDQIRDVIHDCNLAPIRGSRKVYIITRADLLQGAPANAFLKVLEEPPEKVVFILIGRLRSAILPTVLSRCQVVPFRKTPEEESIPILVASVGCDAGDARIALAVSGGSLSHARRWLLSSASRLTRNEMISVLDRLVQCDDLDVLDAARSLMTSLKAPIAETKAALAAAAEESSDYLAKSAMKTLEERQKRELSAREREGLMEACAIVRSWLADCLLYLEAPDESLVNGDCADSVYRAASATDTAGVIVAIKATDEAVSYLQRNVTPQLVIETMLFKIREALLCRK